MIRFKKLISLITEAKIDDIKAKNPDIDPNLIDRYNAVGGTHSGRFLPWIIKQHKGGKIGSPNMQRLSRTIENYGKHGSKLNVKDINSYNLDELEEALRPHVEKSEKNKAELERRKKVVEDGSDKIYEDGKNRVYNVHSKDASCELGRGTKWCVGSTQSDNPFYGYKSDGDFFVVHGKDKEGKPQKFGIHFERGEFQNEKNINVGPYYIVGHNPWLKNVPEFQFKHSAFTTDENKEKDLNFQPKRSELLDNSNHPNLRAKKIAEHPNLLSLEDNKKLLFDKSEHPEVRKAAIKNLLTQDLSDEEVRKIIMDKNEHYGVRTDLASSEGFSNSLDKEHVNELLKEDNSLISGIKSHLLQKQWHITPEHVHNILSNTKEDPVLRYYAMAFNKKHVTPQHIHNILSNPKESNEIKELALRTNADKVRKDSFNNLMNGDVSKMSDGMKIGIASNIYATPEHLDKIAKSTDNPDVFHYITNRNNHNGVLNETLLHIANKVDKNGTLNSIANNRNALDDTLRIIGDKSDSWEVHGSIAQHPNASDDTLRMLGDKSDNTVVHEAIAQHPNASDDTLRMLGDKSNNDLAHEAIASHQNASDDTLRMLADKSKESFVHDAIVNHRNASNATKEKSNDFLSLNDKWTPQEKVDKLAKKYLNNKNFHYVLADHPNASDNTLHMIGDKSDYTDVHKTIADHRNASDNTLRMIGDKSEDSLVHRLIADRSHASDDTLRMIGDKSNNDLVHEAIAQHSNASTDTLRMLGDKSNNPDVHQTIANHPNASDDTLRIIGKKSRYYDVHKTIANHRNASDDTLRMLGEKSEDYEVHKAILDHQNASDKTKELSRQKLSKIQ